VGPFLFAFGSALGAVVAWFVGRHEPDRATVFAFSGIVSGLLGALTTASWRSTAPAIEVGLGLLGTAAPLTLCLTRLPATASRGGAAAALRRFVATLALALVFGIACATIGFVSVVGVRHLSEKMNLGESAGSPIELWRKPFHALSAAASAHL
jgi:hypothetical protein